MEILGICIFSNLTLVEKKKAFNEQYFSIGGLIIVHQGQNWDGKLITPSTQN